MTIFFTSDLHFSHRNVIEYCQRPFKDIDEMNEAIVSQWNSQVKTEDIVYVLGDFSLNPNAMSLFFPRLNGSKVLVAGNHDQVINFYKASPTYSSKSDRKAAKNHARYLSEGWKEIHQELRVTLKTGPNLEDSIEVLLAHLPYATKESLEYDDRYLESKPIDYGLVLLHGHLHAKYQKMGKMIDVGWDVEQRLFTEEDIVKIINDSREFIPSRLTDFYKSRVDNRQNMKGQ